MEAKQFQIYVNNFKFMNISVPYFVFFFFPLQEPAGKGELIVFGPADNSETQSGTSESGNSICAGRIMLNDSDPLLPSSGSPFRSALQGETFRTSNAVSGKAYRGH